MLNRLGVSTQITSPNLYFTRRGFLSLICTVTGAFWLASLPAPCDFPWEYSLCSEAKRGSVSQKRSAFCSVMRWRIA